MQTATENQTNYLKPVQVIFDYYRDLFKEPSTPRHLPQYGQNIFHFTNLFLKESELVRFNMDGTLAQTADGLPNNIALVQLMFDFLNRYNEGHLSSTQEQFKFLATVSKKRKIEHKLATPSLIPDNHDESSLVDEKKEESKEAQGGVSPAMSLTFTSYIETTPISKKRVSDWSESEFAKSVRLIYNFYETHAAEYYLNKIIFRIAKLEQFTTGKGKSIAAATLSKFNQFLEKFGFITQSNKHLYSIQVTEKEFPARDEELLKLFWQFKQYYYRKQLPSKLTVADFQRHHAKPPAAAIPDQNDNKAAIRFILNEPEPDLNNSLNSLKW
jgi:hypothetical protein